MEDSKFEEITSQLLIEKITELASSRFTALKSGEQDIIDLYSEEDLTDKAVLKLRRNIDAADGVRTLLIIVLDSYDEFKNALRWAALVKDELLEPENGDLYMFVAIKDKNISVEQCTNIESSDRICRKYILGQGKLY